MLTKFENLSHNAYDVNIKVFHGKYSHAVLTKPMYITSLYQGSYSNA